MTDAEVGGDVPERLRLEIVTAQDFAFVFPSSGERFAEVADRKYQAALSETRVAAREFEVELQIFRETLSQVTGRND
jgi:hypothetical protein